MFTSRRLRATRAALRTAHLKAIAKDARIRELETNLTAAEDRSYALARSRTDVDHVIELERQVKQLTGAVLQLRKGVVDDAQTAELRRQLGVERSVTRALEQRLADLQAANSGIPTLRQVAA